MLKLKDQIIRVVLVSGTETRYHTAQSSDQIRYVILRSLGRRRNHQPDSRSDWDCTRRTTPYEMHRET